MSCQTNLSWLNNLAILYGLWFLDISFLHWAAGGYLISIACCPFFFICTDNVLAKFSVPVHVWSEVTFLPLPAFYWTFYTLALRCLVWTTVHYKAYKQIFQVIYTYLGVSFASFPRTANASTLWLSELRKVFQHVSFPFPANRPVCAWKSMKSRKRIGIFTP